MTNRFSTQDPGDSRLGACIGVVQCAGWDWTMPRKGFPFATAFVVRVGADHVTLLSAASPFYALLESPNVSRSFSQSRRTNPDFGSRYRRPRPYVTTRPFAYGGDHGVVLTVQIDGSRKGRSLEVVEVAAQEHLDIAILRCRPIDPEPPSLGPMEAVANSREPAGTASVVGGHFEFGQPAWELMSLPVSAEQMAAGTRDGDSAVLTGNEFPINTSLVGSPVLVDSGSDRIPTVVGMVTRSVPLASDTRPTEHASDLLASVGEMLAGRLIIRSIAGILLEV